METGKKWELRVPVETFSSTDRSSEIEKAFLENHEMVYRAAFRITGNTSDAEDVLQTLFLRLVRREWGPDRQLGWPPYLHRAAVNIAIDVMRTRSRVVPLDETGVTLRQNQPGPDREYSATELRELFTTALAELNSTAAEIFVLRYVEGCTIHEIAQMLDTTKGTIAVTLFRTRSRLRKSIGKVLGRS
jgi:RNA polymerase sigma-70 factor (ECF subfamily)